MLADRHQSNQESVPHKPQLPKLNRHIFEFRGCSVQSGSPTLVGLVIPFMPPHAPSPASKCLLKLREWLDANNDEIIHQRDPQFLTLIFPFASLL
jgi:hypothetical protein